MEKVDECHYQEAQCEDLQNKFECRKHEGLNVVPKPSTRLPARLHFRLPMSGPTSSLGLGTV